MNAPAVPRPTAPIGRPGPGQRLHREHHLLEARFRDLHRRALTGDWTDLHAVWSEFCAEFEAHLRFEEEQLFPAYLRSHPSASDEVAALERDHARIRRAMEQLAIEIQLHEIRAHSVDGFLAENRDHARRESERFYPWVDGTEASERTR